MRRSIVRLVIFGSVSAIFAAAASPALADDIVTSVGTNGSTTIALTGQGAGSTVIRYWVDLKGNDCDATTANPATITIGKPAAVTASPATLVFTGCGSATSGFKEVTFSSATPGDHPITAEAAGRGSYNTNKASFTLRVVAPNTPPAVTVTGVSDGASYEHGAVPAAFCNVSDVEDADQTFPATLGPVTGPLSGYGLGSRTATCAHTDSGGLSGSASATFHIVDTTGPVLTVPGDLVAEATDGSGAAVSFAATATATDAVDPGPAVSCTAAPGTFPLGTTPVTCTATDAAGNSASHGFSVTVQDTTAPALRVPATVTTEATGPVGAAVTYAATADDTVDGPLTPACQPASGSVFALGTTPVNCAATDSADNRTQGGFDVVVVDTTPPALHLPAAPTLQATGPGGATFAFSPGADDLVSGPVTVTCGTPSGSLFGIGTTTVSCSAEDAAGNTAAGSFTVTVVDTTAPVLTLPGDLTEQASKSSGADISYAASASDLVDGNVGVSCSPANGTFPIGATPVTCTATDAHGNTASGGFTVTVVDTLPPVLQGVPGDQVVEATGPAGATASFDLPTAQDLVDGAVAVTCAPASGQTFPLGVSTVTCSTADSRGNQATATATITVVDTTAPDVTVPADQTVEATGPAGATAAWSGVSATDLVDGTVPASCDHASGATFPLGVTTVTCRATDRAGNEGGAAFTVVVQDRTAPRVDVPDGQTVEATGPGGAVATWSGVSADDVVDGSVPVGCDPASGATFKLGFTTVTCSATDRAGNTGNGAFVITVVDTTAPALSVPGDRTVEATGPAGATVGYSAGATDVVDGPVPVDCTPAAGATFGLGDTVVACTATDAHGNTATASFTVTVVDTTAPAITVPDTVTVEATGPDGAVATYAASANDAVDGAVAVTCTPASGTTFALGATTVHCTAGDARGNSAAASFTVTVVDTTAPVLNLPGNLAAFATSAAGAALGYRALATDAVAGSFTPACTPAPGATFAPGTTTVTCVATDPAGNTATGSFTVTVTFDFGGFRAPVDGNKVLNAMKSGSTAPIKWQISDQRGGYLGDLGIVSQTASGVVACGGGTVDDLTLFSTGGTVLRYDTVAQQYVYNWQSPKAAGRCYKVTIGLTDGRSYSALFQLR